MKRRIFTVLSALSLLFCIGLMAQWVRSRWASEWLSGERLTGSSKCLHVTVFQVETGRAGFKLFVRLETTSDPEEIDKYAPPGEGWVFEGAWDHFPGSLYSPYPHRRFAGLSWFLKTYTGECYTQRVLDIVVPHWFGVLGCAVLPLLWLRGHRRHRTHRQRIKLGLCLKCGYDLRAHGPGQRCPECGTVVPENLAISGI